MKNRYWKQNGVSPPLFLLQHILLYLCTVHGMGCSLSRFWRIRFFSIYYRYLIQGIIHLELLYVNVKFCLKKNWQFSVEYKWHVAHLAKWRSEEQEVLGSIPYEENINLVFIFLTVFLILTRQWPYHCLKDWVCSFFFNHICDPDCQSP